MTGRKISTVRAAIDQRLSSSVVERLDDDLSLVPRSRNVLEREQHSLAAREHLRRRGDLIVADGCDDLRRPAVGRYAQDAFSSLTEHDAVLVPSHAKRRLSRADRNGGPTADPETLQRLVSAGEERDGLAVG